MKKTLKILSAVLAAAMIICAFSACGKKDTPERKSKTYFGYFDTSTVIYDFSGGSDEAFSANCVAFEAEIDLCHRLFDIYNSYEGLANIKTVNDSAGKEAVAVDIRIIDLLEFSKEMYEKTDGAVNIAMGAVLQIWHEYRERGVGVPTKEELAAAAEHCDITKIEINREKGTVRLTDPEMSLDVGAVAKGFAIDRAAGVLRFRGANSYAIDVGGNLYTIGTKPDGAPFNTGIQDPDGGDYPAYIDVADGAVATSGDYQRFYTVGGVSYHHIINGETLHPSYYHRSVTVYSNSAALSDALSTALFNTQSYDEARSMASKIGGVRELVFIEPDRRVERIKL